MTLAQELEQTKAQLANLQATVTASAAASETFNVKIAALEADKAALLSEKEAMAATISDKDKTISAHAAEIETLKANAKTAEARALEIAAAAGVPPVAAQPKSEEKSIADIPHGPERLAAAIAAYNALQKSNQNQK